MSEINMKKLEKKPYLYDLYRRCGKCDIISLLKWIFVSKYKIVYLKRKCELYRKRGQKIHFLIYRIIYSHYSIKYGVDIGTSVKIGPGFIIQHIGGIAINNGAVIGKDVEILQGVTIGYERRGKRKGNPTIGNKVWIGSNAVIVGKISIGNNVLIAPNSFVNFNVPSNSIVIGNPAKIIKSEKATEQYINNILFFKEKI